MTVRQSRLSRVPFRDGVGLLMVSFEIQLQVEQDGGIDLIRLTVRRAPSRIL